MDKIKQITGQSGESEGVAPIITSWNPRDFPSNLPVPYLTELLREETLLKTVFEQRTNVFENMMYLGMRDNIEEFSSLFSETVSDDFAASTLINEYFFAALMYHGWLVTADGMDLGPRAPFTFSENRFGQCKLTTGEKYVSKGLEMNLLPLIFPKLHVTRSLISLSPMGVITHKSDVKKARDYFITFNLAFNVTAQNCVLQHGGRWLVKDLRNCYSAMNATNDNRINSKVISIEVWKKVSSSEQSQSSSQNYNDDPFSVPVEERVKLITATLKESVKKKQLAKKRNATKTQKEPLTPFATDAECERIIEMYRQGYVLAGGEIGTVVGTFYTSLTGWRDSRKPFDSAGTVQLLALGHALSILGFTYWDMGQTLTYKDGIGCVHTPREHFREILKRHRDDTLPTIPEGVFNAKSIVQTSLQAHRKFNNVLSKELDTGDDDNEYEKHDIFVEEHFLPQVPKPSGLIEELQNSRLSIFKL